MLQASATGIADDDNDESIIPIFFGRYWGKTSYTSNYFRPPRNSSSQWSSVQYSVCYVSLIYKFATENLVEGHSREQTLLRLLNIRYAFGKYRVHIPGFLANLRPIPTARCWYDFVTQATTTSLKIKSSKLTNLVTFPPYILLGSNLNYVYYHVICGFVTSRH
jgi:hypothetical protein